jgi:hypothetical protein
MWVILILISLLAGGFVVYVISTKAIYSILSKEKEYYLRELKLSGRSNFPCYISLVKVLKDRKEHYKTILEENNQASKAEIDRLQGEIKQISLENEELTKKLSIENSTEKDKLKHPDKSGNHQNKEISKDTINTTYFTIPENDGRFKNEYGKSENDGNSYYRIEFESNNSTGQLYYISSSLDRIAIESIDYYLIPVCEIENLSNRKGAFRIELIQPGTVSLKNDSWVIDPDNKVKIRLI